MDGCLQLFIECPPFIRRQQDIGVSPRGACMRVVETNNKQQQKINVIVMMLGRKGKAEKSRVAMIVPAGSEGRAVPTPGRNHW